MTEFILAEVVAAPRRACLAAADLPPDLPLELPLETPPAEITVLAVVEMLLKNPGRLNRLVRDPAYQRELVPSLLAVAIFSLALHGIVMTAIVNWLAVKGGHWFAFLPDARWDNPSAANLTLSFTIGGIAATGICLPSFYFYGLLAGVRISVLGATAHALKGMAAGCVALVGLLPIYVAIALSAIVFPFDTLWAQYVTTVGLALPLIAGLAGMANLYQGFVGLSDTMLPNRAAARQCFLRRLTSAWVACSAFVTPVVIYSLWHWLSNLTQVTLM